MTSDYSSLEDDSLEYLLDYEIERRKAVEEKSLAIIRVNILILGIFVPVVAIILREDVMESIVPVVTNIYTLSGLAVSILALGSSSTIFLFAHAQLSSITTSVDEFIERKDREGNVQTDIAQMTLENLEPFNDLVGMLVLTVFFTSLSVPLLLLGIAEPFIGVDLVLALYILLFSIFGIVISYLFIKFTWQGFIQTYQTLRSEYSKAKSAIRSTVQNSTISNTDVEGIISLLSLMVGLAIGLYLAPELPRILTEQMTLSGIVDRFVVMAKGILIVVSTSIGVFLLTVLVLAYNRIRKREKELTD